MRSFLRVVFDPNVLRRPKLRRYIETDQAARYVAEIVRRSEMHDDPGHVEAVSPDVDDDYLVALARLTAADGLVSGDQDLTRLTLGDVTIWTSRQLLDQLTAALEGEFGG